MTRWTAKLTHMAVICGATALSGCGVPLHSSGMNFGAQPKPTSSVAMQEVSNMTGAVSDDQSKQNFCNARGVVDGQTQSFQSQIEDTIKELTPTDPQEQSLLAGSVAANLAKMIGQAAVNGYHAGRSLARNTSDSGQGDRDALQPGTIGPFDLKAFGERLHSDFLHPAARSTISTGSNGSQFWTGLARYYMAYFDGNFTDRFGNKLAKPAFGGSSSAGAGQVTSVTDADIAGAVAVFIEYIADRIVATPVWTSDSGDTAGAGASGTYYYPGGTTNEPTALSLGYTISTGLLDDPADGLGITKTKARVIRYISDAAGSEALILGGTIGGSFGGIGVSLGAFGKFSIGDNQTLQTILKAALAHAFVRAAEQASCEIVARIPELAADPSTDIKADLAASGRFLPTLPNSQDVDERKLNEFATQNKILRLHKAVISISRANSAGHT